MGNQGTDRRGGLLAVSFLCGLMAALGAGAADITVQPGDDLTAIVNGSTTDDVIRLEGSGDTNVTQVYPLEDTLYINNNRIVTIREASGGYLPTRIVIQGPDTSSRCTDNQVVNPGFEEGDPPWEQPVAPVQPNPIMDSPEAYEGSRLAQFEGVVGETDPPIEIIQVPVIPAVPIKDGIEGDIRIPAVPMRFGFQLSIPQVGDPADTLEVVLGGVPLRTISAGESQFHGGFDLVLFDLDPVAYPPGSTQMLTLSATTTAQPNPTIFHIDYVSFYDAVLTEPVNDIALVANPGFEDFSGWLPIAGSRPLEDLIVSAPGGMVYPTFPANDFVLRFGGFEREPTVLEFQLNIQHYSGDPGDKLEVFMTDSFGDEIKLLTIPDQVDVALHNQVYGKVSITLADRGEFVDNQPHVLRFRAQLMTAQEPTTFLVDDVCINAVGGLAGSSQCLPNALLDGGFETGGPGNPHWSGPSTDSVITQGGTGLGYSANTDDWYALFRGAEPDRRVIEQRVTIGSDLLFLRFYFQALADSGTGLDEFEVSIWDDESDSAPLVFTYPADAVSSGWSQETLDISSKADNSEKILRFEGRFAHALVPSVILLDQICLSFVLLPVIELDAATLNLMNVAITNGSTGVIASSGANLNVERCYFQGLSDYAISLATASNAVISQTVVNGGGDGIHMTDGSATIFQCTLLQCGGYGVRVEGGVANIIANLIYNCSAGALENTASGVNLPSYLNLLIPPVFPGFVIAGSPQSQIPVWYSGPNDWPGKLALTSPLETSVTLSSLEADATYPLSQSTVAAINAYARDFESQSRDGLLEIGADEVQVDDDPEPVWLECTVTPTVSNGTHYVAVPQNNTVNVSITVENISLEDAVLYLVPEEGDLFDSMQRKEYPFSTTSNSASFEIPINPARPWLDPSSAPEGEELFLEGLAKLYLVSEGTIYGDGQSEDSIVFDIEDTMFIIDLNPPQISDVALTSRANQLVVYSNDSLLTSLDSSNVDSAWAALGAPMPDSLGTLDPVATYDPNMFFNNLEFLDDDVGLAVGVEITFGDPVPVDSNRVSHNVETAGFRIDPQTLTSSDGDILFEGWPLQSGGNVRWIEEEGSGGLGEGYTATVTATPTSTTVDGKTRPGVLARWDLTKIFPQIGSSKTWHFMTRFAAADIAGNQTETDVPLHLWWMQNAQATITSGPADDEMNPSFTWQLDRGVGGEAPSNTNNAWPLVSFRLFRSVNPANPDASEWVEVGFAWSSWTRGPITKYSMLPEGALGDILEDNANLGQEMLLIVRGADEAGNVQGDGSYPPNPTLADFAAYGYSGWTWKNPGSEAIDLDTSIQAEFWHNRTGPTVTATELRRASGDENYFGPSTSIPLPPLNETDMRVEAKISVNYSTPDDLEYTEKPYIRWDLFEDGHLVAGGIHRWNSSSASPGPLPIHIPYDILNPGIVSGPQGKAISVTLDPTLPDHTAFLNFGPLGPGWPQDRLGDDGYQDELDTSGNPKWRRREVKYLFTARTVIIAADSSEEVFDSTPASVNFTITVDEPVQDVQPVKRIERE